MNVHIYGGDNMTTRTEKLANNYVWKSEYSNEYKDGYNKIDWKQQANDDKWEEIKTDSGRITYRLKNKKDAT